MKIEVYSTGKNAYRVVSGKIDKNNASSVRSWIDSYNDYYTSDFKLDKIDSDSYLMLDSEDNREYVIKVGE